MPKHTHKHKRFEGKRTKVIIEFQLFPMEKGKKCQELNKTQQNKTNNQQQTKNPQHSICSQMKKIPKTDKEIKTCATLCFGQLNYIQLLQKKVSFFLSAAQKQMSQWCVLVPHNTAGEWLRVFIVLQLVKKNPNNTTKKFLVGFPIVQQSQKKSSVPALCTCIAGSFCFS